MQFMIIGRDGKDGGAADRRMAARPDHLVGLKARMARGEILKAGALLSHDGGMVGSMLLCEFPDRAALDLYLGEEPYVAAGVWRDVEIQPIRLLD